MKERKVRKKRTDIENKKFVASTIDAKGLQHDRCVTQVKVPYWFKVSIYDKAVTETATYELIAKKPFPKKWDVESSTSAIIQFTNKCPKCKNIGTPRIDKKDLYDYHYRPGTNSKKNPSKQKEQYRLIYFHKQEDQKYKPCIIEKFHKGKGIFRKNGAVSNTVKDYSFPGYTIENN